MRQVVEPQLLDVDLPAEPRSVAQARRAVQVALRGLAVDRDAVTVVVSEAVSNAVVHAYRECERPGAVHVTARLDEDGVEVSVTDAGLGMVPRVDSPGIGLGVPLMVDLSDRVEIATGQDGGTQVTARFALMGAAGPHGRAARPFHRAERQTARLAAA